MSFNELIEQYGAILIAAVIALECIGLPLPGEAVLFAAAIYAGSHADLPIAVVIAAAAVGAVVGNITGYVIGRKFGYPLLLRYGRYLHLTESRIKVGQYLFDRHGSKVVVAARFIAVLRSVTGILAGANRMPWRRFVAANIAGAIAWAGLYGLGAYYLGHEVHTVARPAAIAIAAVAVVAFALGAVFLARNEPRLAAEAERAFPGPL